MYTFGYMFEYRQISTKWDRCLISYTYACTCISAHSLLGVVLLVMKCFMFSAGGTLMGSHLIVLKECCGDMNMV